MNAYNNYLNKHYNAKFWMQHTWDKLYTVLADQTVLVVCENI